MSAINHQLAKIIQSSKTISALTTALKNNPVQFDRIKRIRRLLGDVSENYRIFDKFSRTHDRAIVFLQIGANDGLRNDPIREFVVRDHWKGVFVEPNPIAFESLKKNYSYLDNKDLVFVNAAMSTVTETEVSFWVHNFEYASTLSQEDRLALTRKSSFIKNRLLEHLYTQNKGNEIVIADISANEQKYISELKIPCYTVQKVIEKFNTQGKLDVLAIDAEGYDAKILMSIDFQTVRPGLIFFETTHIQTEKEQLYSYLKGNGYTITDVDSDAFATLR